MRTSGKGLAVSVPGIGHSDIRGLVTAGQWSAVNSYSLASWITVLCAVRVLLVDNSDLEMFQASSRCSRCFQPDVRRPWYGLHLIVCSLRYFRGNVKGLSLQAMRSTLYIIAEISFL